MAPPKFNDVSRELLALRDQDVPVEIELTPVEAWMIISQLQLALRHPENHGPSADVGRQLLNLLAERVAKTPALAALLQAGWDQSCDVEVH